MIDEKTVIKDIQEWSKEREIKWTTESVITLLEAAPSLGDLRPCKVTIVKNIVVGLLEIKEEKEEHNAYSIGGMSILQTKGIFYLLLLSMKTEVFIL